MSDRGRSPRRGQNVATVSNIPVTIEDRPTVSPFINVNSNNNTTVPPPVEFDIGPSFSRRPSLDLGHGPQGALAVVLCGAHGPGGRQGGTLSAGNTLTRLGSRHTATNVEYAVPHHFHHHGGAYVEYHHDQMSPSDDDDSEPGYATGTNMILDRFEDSVVLDVGGIVLVYVCSMFSFGFIRYLWGIFGFYLLFMDYQICLEFIVPSFFSKL